jgi:hypothetical protein
VPIRQDQDWAGTEEEEVFVCDWKVRHWQRRVTSVRDQRQKQAAELPEDEYCC